MWSWLLGSTFNTSNPEANSTASGLATGAVNPATGLPMTSGDSMGIDIGGNPFGVDLHANATTSMGSDSFGGFD